MPSNKFRPRSLTLGAPRRSHLHSHTVITNALRLIWVVLVIWGDLGMFFWSLSGCSWPEVDVGHKTHQKFKATHVLLVADPQVQHPRLLPQGSWWANPLRRIMFKLNLRKSWHATMRLRPNVVIFLGDMLANGKVAKSLEEYQEAARHFKYVFATDPRTEVYYVPGNNDVGLGSASTIGKNLRSYYTDSFGPPNQQLIIANHTFIALDSPALVDEDYRRHGQSTSFENWKPIEGGPVEFVKEVGEYGPGNVILLSHIPLSRSETADCGPLRERGGIRRGAGPGYQATLGRQTTHFLLQNLDPLVVFSADNRDYCDYTHVLPGTRPDGRNYVNAIREVTVKSFSMSVHIRKPGFQLLSLVHPALVANPEYHSFADRPCLLPDQAWIYSGFYLPCIVVTMFALIFINFNKKRSLSSKKPEHILVTPSPHSSGRTSPNPSFHTESPHWNVPWSPYSPAAPASPRTTLPSYLRTPHTRSASVTHLVASLPGSPAPTSPTAINMPKPLPERGYDDFEDDAMYPTQYATRREGHSLRPREDDEWLHVHHNEKDEPESGLRLRDQDAEHNSTSPRFQSQFILAPDQFKSSSAKKGKFSWSYTFVLRGSRRRISVGIPNWNSLHNFLDLFGLNFSSGSHLGTRRNRVGSVISVFVDTLSVFWPAMITWFIINWTIL